MPILVALLPLLFGLALAAALLAAGLRRVPADAVLTVHRFGRYRRTLAPGWRWHWPLLDRLGPAVALTGHHLHVASAPLRGEAELYYQILEPERTGQTLDQVDDWVAAQTRDALAQAGASAEQLKAELNRRVGRLGLRIVRCALHTA